MKYLRRVLAILLVFVVLLSSSISVAAANACLTVNGKSTNKKTVITVSTGNAWLVNEKITFTQTKGTISYNNNHCGQSKVDTYGAYTVKVSYKKNGKTYNKSYAWKYTKNFSVTLDKNRTYTITITPYNVNTIGQYLKQNNKTVKFNTAHNSTTFRWSKAATWKVKSTRAVNWCYSAS